MKRFLALLLPVLLIALLVACFDQQAGPAETPAPTQTQAQNTPSEAPAPNPSPTPEPGPFAPRDIFGSAFNPYADAGFPDNFTIYAASFSKGAVKLEGRNPYVLSMTAEGKTDEAIAFLAKLAGIEDTQIAAQHAGDFKNGGYCEFFCADGTAFTVKKTDPNDDRYEYVEGCYIEITVDVNAADMEKYIDFVRDNYNLNALEPISEYLDIEPDFAQCDFNINLHKKQVGVSVMYHISDADAVLRNIAENIESDWYDAENTKMSLTYGMITLGLGADPRGEGFYIDQTAAEFDTALSEYIAPEISLTKLGFGFDQEGVCGVYFEHEPHYMDIAVRRPEWGAFADGWNMEYLDEVNGYGLLITYHTDENKYRISLSKNDTGAVFCYYPATGEYVDEHPDPDTIRQVFNDAFGTEGEDFYDKPMARFEQLVRELFGMSIEELYALPIR